MLIYPGGKYVKFLAGISFMIYSVININIILFNYDISYCIIQNKKTMVQKEQNLVLHITYEVLHSFPSFKQLVLSMYTLLQEKLYFGTLNSI